MLHLLTILIGCMCLLAVGCAAVNDGASGKADRSQILYPAGSQGSFAGPEEYFTGKVRVDLLFPKNEHTEFSGAYVTFEPGARTAWHLHPAGQHMIVTEGVALTGTRDGKIVDFREGETVWCPPGIDHWHGATPDQPMTHLVITGSKDGQNVIWKERVTDPQYNPAELRHNETSTMNEATALSGKQKSIILIAAFTASGDMDRLKPALSAGLDAGLTVNEVKEILVQMYAYTDPQLLDVAGRWRGCRSWRCILGTSRGLRRNPRLTTNTHSELTDRAGAVAGLVGV